MLGTWRISIPAIALTGAIALFVVAMSRSQPHIAQSATDAASR